MENIHLKYSDSPEANEKIREDCCPGNPYIVFSTRPGVPLLVVNPQRQSGHFSHTLTVGDGDSVVKLAAQISRVDKYIKGNIIKRNKKAPQ